MPAFVTSFSSAALRRIYRPSICRTPKFTSLFTATLLPATLPFSTLAESSSSTPKMTLSDLKGIKDIEGKAIDTAKFAGKVVFAMNVASACGYTKPGYELLKRLTDKYSQQDFVAIAIPCNSFGWQESGSPDDIKTFALARADKLVITERAEVNGKSPHPIVGLAKETFPGRINWNFAGRFVFDKTGTPVARFGNDAQPEEIEAAIDKAL